MISKLHTNKRKEQTNTNVKSYLKAIKATLEASTRYDLVLTPALVASLYAVLLSHAWVSIRLLCT